MELHFTGLIMAAATFFTIGLFHPLVIKGEYYFGVKCWRAFFVVGIAAVTASIFVANIFGSLILAAVGASSLWGIGEVFQQRKRVERGWFPKRPQGHISIFRRGK